MMLLPVIVTGTLLTLSAFILPFNRVGWPTSLHLLKHSSSQLLAIRGMPTPAVFLSLVAMGNEQRVRHVPGWFRLCGWGAMALGNYLFMSRMLLAWSFDRIVLKISEVNDRLHSPIVSPRTRLYWLEGSTVDLRLKHSQINTSFVASYFWSANWPWPRWPPALFPPMSANRCRRTRPPGSTSWGYRHQHCRSCDTTGRDRNHGHLLPLPHPSIPSVATTAEVLLIPLAIGPGSSGRQHVRQNQGI